MRPAVVEEAKKRGYVSLSLAHTSLKKNERERTQERTTSSKTEKSSTISESETTPPKTNAG